MNEKGPDPYAVWRSQVYAFVLCWKHSPELKHTYQRDLIKKIAWLVPVDFTQGRCNSYQLRGRQMYSILSDEWNKCLQWINTEPLRLKFTYTPCQVCLRPCSTFDKGVPVAKCLKESHRGLVNTCTACWVVRDGMCKECTKQLCKRKNLLVSFNSLFNKKAQ